LNYKIVEQYSTYWVNGVQQKIIVNSGLITSFAVSGGSVYMAGQAGCYINGVLRRPEAPNFHTMFAVSRGRVYLTGYEWDGHKYTACYWVDGVRYDLDGSRATSIFVEQ